MKVLILTDSLSLPRSNCEDIQENVLYEDTYIYKLKKCFSNIDIIHCGIGGATISDLKAQVFYFKEVKPDVVFVQTGIVDCAPRYLSRELNSIIRVFRLSRLVRFFIRNRRTTYTSPEKFKNTLISIKDSFNNRNFYTVGILPAMEEYEKMLPGVTTNIESYNLILQEHSKYISSNDFAKCDIFSDYHHLSKQGHYKLFLKLNKIILELKK